MFLRVLNPHLVIASCVSVQMAGQGAVWRVCKGGAGCEERSAKVSQPQLWLLGSTAVLGWWGKSCPTRPHPHPYHHSFYLHKMLPFSAGKEDMRVVEEHWEQLG